MNASNIQNCLEFMRNHGITIPEINETNRRIRELFHSVQQNTRRGKRLLQKGGKRFSEEKAQKYSNKSFFVNTLLDRFVKQPIVEKYKGHFDKDVANFFKLFVDAFFNSPFCSILEPVLNIYLREIIENIVRLFMEEDIVADIDERFINNKNDSFIITHGSKNHGVRSLFRPIKISEGETQYIVEMYNAARIPNRKIVQVACLSKEKLDEYLNLIKESKQQESELAIIRIYSFLDEYPESQIPEIQGAIEKSREISTWIEANRERHIQRIGNCAVKPFLVILEAELIRALSMRLGENHPLTPLIVNMLTNYFHIFFTSANKSLVTENWLRKHPDIGQHIVEKEAGHLANFQKNFIDIRCMQILNQIVNDPSSEWLRKLDSCINDRGSSLEEKTRVIETLAREIHLNLEEPVQRGFFDRVVELLSERHKYANNGPDPILQKEQTCVVYNRLLRKQVSPDDALSRLKTLQRLFREEMPNVSVKEFSEFVFACDPHGWLSENIMQVIDRDLQLHPDYCGYKAGEYETIVARLFLELYPEDAN